MSLAITIAALLVQAPPVTAVPRPAPSAAVAQLQARRVAQRAEARRLVAQAEAMRARYTPRPGQPTRAQVDAAIRQARDADADTADSMADMSQDQQMHLQMLLDRREQAMAMLSNMMKAMASTDDGIAQNMK